MAALSRIFLVALLLAAGLVARPAAAAESYDNCTGFIDSLPATISTQGVWCLRQNLTTNITTGNAIEISTNNVAIDCNDFKIGGLAAGNDSSAFGIFSVGHQNATVRQCSVRGFFYGIALTGGAGHLVENSRLDNNLYIGIFVSGDNIEVRRNLVYDTGGQTGSSNSIGINASGNIIDNTVSGLFVDVSGGSLTGINVWGRGTQVRGNQISGLDSTAAQGGSVDIVGIRLSDLYLRASGNHVVADVSNTGSGQGIAAYFNSAFCLDNTVGGFATNIDSNCTGTGNVTRP